MKQNHLKQNRVSKLLVWGFESTIDYRFRLTATDFQPLGLAAPAQDREEFISQEEFAALLARLQSMDYTPSPAPGGSPFISALAAQEWLLAGGHKDAAAFFIGALPQAARDLLPPHLTPVIAHARLTPGATGTLSLENTQARAKVMLAVPEGRFLDGAAATASCLSLDSLVGETAPDYLLLGAGGLNKADPCSLARVLAHAGAIPCRQGLFLSGNSFQRLISDSGNAERWRQLYEIMISANILSVSQEEHDQIVSVRGDGWVAESQAAVVCHSPDSARLCNDRPGLGQRAHIEAAISVARAQASAYAGQALTGLGARFDGVLSAALLTAVLLTAMEDDQTSNQANQRKGDQI